MTASTSAKIVVEPPSRLQKNQVVYPPIVLTIPGHQADPSTHFFATAVLVDSSGNVLDAALSGTTAVTGGFLASGAMAFVFPDLAILKEGSFRIRVDLYGMVYGDDSGATLLAQEYTGKISVKGRPVSPTKPCKLFDTLYWWKIKQRELGPS